jgi:uncharacterized protein YjbI with pentapeptide repeats
MKAIYLGEYECKFEGTGDCYQYSDLFLNSHDDCINKSLPGFHIIQNNINYQTITLNKDIEKLIYSDLKLFNVEFINSIFNYNQFKRCVFTNVHFMNNELTNNIFKSCYFLNCSFDENDFTANTFKDCKFEHTNVYKCNFYDNAINSIHFVNSNFKHCFIQPDHNFSKDQIKTHETLVIDNCNFSLKYKKLN